MEKKYWDGFYNRNGAPVRPSDFALYIEKEYSQFVNSVVDVGCGNGRDSFHFASKDINCIGIDQSDSAVKINNSNIPSEILNLKFIHGDFPSFDYKSLNVDKLSVYSRFTLHSINYDEEKVFFDNLRGLDCLDYLFIEVRSINDEIYGDGKEVGKHEFITSHYRRFIDPKIIKEKLKRNFKILYFKQGINFAKYKKENPWVLRIIAKKK